MKFDGTVYYRRNSIYYEKNKITATIAELQIIRIWFYNFGIFLNKNARSYSTSCIALSICLEKILRKFVKLVNRFEEDTNDVASDSYDEDPPYISDSDSDFL